MTDPDQDVSMPAHSGAVLAVAVLMGLAQVALTAAFGHRGPLALTAVGVLGGGMTWGTLTAVRRRLGGGGQSTVQPRLDVRRHLESLADIGTALSAALSREEVAAAVVGRAATAMSADICTLYVLDEWDGSLELIGDAGVAPPVLERIRRISAGDENPAFATLKSQRPMWVENETEYRRLFPSLATIPSQGPRARAFWSMPLIVEGLPIGLLAMGFYQPRAFSPEDRNFVETFAGYCAQAVRRAQRLDTERRLRRAAEHAEASLSTTLRSIGDAVITTDKAGRVTFMNPVAEQLTGWQERDARERPLRAVFRIVNEATRQEVESPVEKVLRDGVVVGLANHTVLLGRQPGQETAIDDSGAPIRDESGVHGVVLVFRDVTAQKVEEARRTFLVDAAAALASSLDPQVALARLADLLVPRFGDWCAIDIVENDLAAPRRLAVAHVDPEKVRLARDLGDRYPDGPGGFGGEAEVLRTGRAELHAEITDEMLRRAAQDDEHHRILTSLNLRSAMIVPLRAREHTLGAITLVHAESGRRYGPGDLTFLEDVARRAAIFIDNARLYESERRAHASAVIANRTKDEFLATISHELRTPLNAILGWARLMAKTPQDEARRTRAIEVIDRNATAMAQLIEDLLDVSRIISGKVRLEIGTVEIERVIHAAADSVRLGLDAKGLTLQITVHGDLGPVLGDANRLQQVLWNLLTNAVKFTPQGGRIDVAVERRGTFVQITVSDTGKGIRADFLPFVFDPFRQGDGTITRTQGGLGLGLAITRHLVELHGGAIQAQSAGEGQGATFTVSLPSAAVPRARSERPSEGMALARAPQPPQLQGLKVLAVDDDLDARQLVQAVLQECGSIVRLAGSVGEALRAIEEEVPDVLLSDIGMPGEDGYALIRRVRTLPSRKGGNVPAAALTAYTRAEDRAQVLDAGFTVHLPKPVAPDDLITAVVNLAQLALRNAAPE